VQERKDLAAGWKAVGATLLQRVGTAWFVLGSSSAAVELTERALGQAFVGNRRLKLILKIGAMALSCWFAVPLTQAVCMGQAWKENANGFWYYKGT